MNHEFREEDWGVLREGTGGPGKEYLASIPKQRGTLKGLKQGSVMIGCVSFKIFSPAAVLRKIEGSKTL